MQAATILDKVFPTDQPDKELLLKIGYEIMEFKVEQLEKILKNKQQFFLDVNRKFLIELLDEYYKQQENFCSFCREAKCSFCQKSYFLEEELRNLKFSTSDSGVLVWKISYMKKIRILLLYVQFELIKNDDWRIKH